ncbi:MAG: hypothetical protein IPL47_01300 [Phyllobacteriaceae bacterium]|nr:hypothetical protein [Phyllobacteriaceae bacterium]
MDKEADPTVRLLDALERASGLRTHAQANPAVARRRSALRQWQSTRLAATHADLLAAKRFHLAADFFLTELYGDKDASGRDADIARVVPTLAKYLPASGVETVADAVELDALSEDLDAAMANAIGSGRIDAAAYGAAWRKVGRRDDRERQIDLVEHLGHALDRLTRRAFAGTALKLMRKPAAIAGFTDLQAFLETGFDAFLAMGKGADEFLEAIVSREHAILVGLFAGDDSVLASGARL